MNSKRCFAALTGLVLLGCIRASHATPPNRAMILDGESGGPYHAWQETTPYLKRMLEESGLFQVDVVTHLQPAAISPPSSRTGASTRLLCSITMRPTSAGRAI